MSINVYKNMLQNILYPTQKEQLDENVEEVEKEIIAEKSTKDSDDEVINEDITSTTEVIQDTKPAIAENADIKDKNIRAAIRSIFSNVTEAYDWKAAAKIEYERQRKEAHAKGEKLKDNTPSPERYHRSNMNSGMSSETAIKRAPTTTSKERDERNAKRNYTKD